MTLARLSPDRVRRSCGPASGWPRAPSAERYDTYQPVMNSRSAATRGCSENCPKAFNANSAKFASKANLQLVQSGQLKQVACPLTAKPCAPGKTVTVAGVEVGFCCPNCQGKVAKATGDEQLDLIFKDTTKGFKAATK